MEEKHICANCGSAMQFIKREDVQLGQTGFLLGVWPNLMAGALDVEIWCCPTCRKLDFFLADVPEEEDRMAQTICQECGTAHDLDDPKCPRCGARNWKL